MATNKITDGHDLLKHMYLSNAFTIQQISYLCGLSPYLIRKVLSNEFEIKQDRTGTREKSTTGLSQSELNRIISGLVKYYNTEQFKIDKVLSSLKRPVVSAR